MTEEEEVNDLCIELSTSHRHFTQATVYGAPFIFGSEQFNKLQQLPSSPLLAVLLAALCERLLLSLLAQLATVYSDRPIQS